MNKIYIVLFWFSQFVWVEAQEIKIYANPVSKIKKDMDIFCGFDELRNLYYLKNNVVHKNTIRELWQYKNVSLGKITKIDFQNQLKLMLFYENFNIIVLLDNQLSELQKISFSENEFPILATAAGIASQNKLWIYNSLTQQLGLYDYIKNNYRPITPSISGTIKHYQSDFNTFQWIDENLNWYSCDVFGKIQFIGKVSNFDQIQTLEEQKIMACKAGNIFVQDVKKNITYPIENIDKSFDKFYYRDQILSIFTNQNIINYKIKLP